VQDDDTPRSAPPARPPSVPPQGQRPPTPSVHPSEQAPLGGIGRILFAIAWIALQAFLISTAGRRPDGAFGFRMFAESSSIKVVLYREVRGERIHVDDGAWFARDAGGTVRRFAWHDRVRPDIGVFDREVHASYGARTQLARLQGALDDVAGHIAQDAETTRLVLDVTIRRNGREPETFHLQSRERPLPGGG
jgi:hypothetical protein